MGNKIHVGTSGWSYQHWRDVFYPPRLGTKNWLPFYASIFPTTLGLISERFKEASGTALGLAITCGWLGSVAISPAFGFVAHHATFSTAYLVIVAGTAAMVIVVAIIARQPQRAEATARAAHVDVLSQ